MNLRRLLGWLAAFSIAAVVAVPQSAPAVDPGRDQFTRLRHTVQIAVEEAVAIKPADPDAPSIPRPLFNARSCAECHRQGGIGGGGPNENNVRLIDRSLVPNLLGFGSHFGSTTGVAVFHHRGVAAEYADWRLDLIELLAPDDPELAERVKAGTEGAGRAAFAVNILPTPTSARRSPFEFRNTPPLFGLRLIETIPQDAVDAVAAGQHVVLRGRSPRLPGGGRGRFGWKAGTATLAHFNENACAVELGLSTPRFQAVTFDSSGFGKMYVETLDTSTTAAAPTDDKPTAEKANMEKATTEKASVDMTEADLAALTQFVARLPAPRQVIEPRLRNQIAAGQKHFRTIGCVACHVPDLGGVTGIYSDLLVHSIATKGTGFYGVPSSTPAGREPDFDIVRADEFRTPPLWGVADSGPYLHDGSADTLEKAILAHGDQALSTRIAFENQLSTRDREALLAFLNSLRAPR